MSETILFMFPGACTRVTMSALEEAQVQYQERFVNLRSNEQASSAYVALNPKAKVPMLHIDGEMMTENAAIIALIDRLHPQARLLPHGGTAVQDMQGLVDLIWCAGTLHPWVRQIRAPTRVTKGDTSGVYELGMYKFAHECELIQERVSGGRWWYGSEWSIVDVYFYWLYINAEKGGFPLKDYPDLVRHSQRVAARPSVQRALAREEAVIAAHRADLSDDFVL